MIKTVTALPAKYLTRELMTLLVHSRLAEDLAVRYKISDFSNSAFMVTVRFGFDLFWQALKIVKELVEFRLDVPDICGCNKIAQVQNPSISQYLSSVVGRRIGCAALIYIERLP